MITRFVQVPVGQWQRVESKMAKADNAIHKLLFVAQHDDADVEKLKQISDQVNYPDSVKYGNFLSYDEVYQSVLSKTTENGRILEQWAKTNDLKITKITKNKQYIMAEASVDTVERVFQTKLQEFKHLKTGKTILRSTSFVLPFDIHNRMALIGGMSHFPHIRPVERLINDVPQVLANAPLLYGVSSGFGHYQFRIVPLCHDGKAATDSLCGNQFDGFQIHISEQLQTFNISVAQANCQVCSHASRLVSGYCDTAGLESDQLFCLFYLEQNDSVPLYEPHTFTVRTRFLDKLSKTAKYNIPLEKGIDITPPVLRSLYNVDDSPNATRDQRSRQAIAGFQEYMDMKSFKRFAKLFGKKFSLLFGKVYGEDFNDPNNDETETALDVEYMPSMGSSIPMDYISSAEYYDGFLIDFSIQLALLEENKTNVVPLVYSISYGVDENEVDAAYIQTCEVQFLIMSVTGKTIFTSSGDCGSTGSDSVCYNVSIPSYPSSSAYVTSVGATQFVQTTGNCSRQLNGYCLEEIVAMTSSKTGCLITSGGGFSNFIQSPTYQSKAVDTYLKKNRNRLPPETYFNRSNRAYPDISLAGHQYLITVFGNAEIFVDGTSASSPTTAGLFSLIVDRRFKLGMQPLGMLNPLLYYLSATSPTTFYDITKGNTKCNESPDCCQYGFVASNGWDPATGLGSINHRALMKQLTKK